MNHSTRVLIQTAISVSAFFIGIVVVVRASEIAPPPPLPVTAPVELRTDYYLNLSGNHIQITTDSKKKYIVDPDSLEEFIIADNL